MIENTAKFINVTTGNNCLQTQVFIQIHFAPNRKNLPEPSQLKNQLYYCKNDDSDDIFFRLVDIMFCTFGQINNHFTLWADAVDAQIWKNKWQLQYPQTTDESDMCIYYYQKAKN